MPRGPIFRHDVFEIVTKTTAPACQNFMMALVSEGYDSCPMEGFIPEKYNEILGLNERNLSATLVLPVGYRAEDDFMTHQKKVRKQVEEIVIDIS